MQTRVVAILCAVLTGCASMKPSEQKAPVTTDQVDTSIGMAGFDPNEAKALLELCIDLNNQDDRNKNQAPSNPAVPNLSSWTPISDSRRPGDPNPETNGFGSFNNAWRLWKWDAKSAPSYAVAIRGTVSQFNSILDDVLATTIVADGGLEYPKGKFLPIKFADTPRAEVHLGFAYALFSLMFEKNKGVMAGLRTLPLGSRIYITGHSQGAAIATLMHAFLHYAINDKSNRYGLSDRGFVLKSYVFAQPKPGNQQFGMDFARIASSRGNAFVLNNTLDSVPQVPLTLQSPNGALQDAFAEGLRPGKLSHLAINFMRGMVQLGNHLVASELEKKTAEMMKSESREDDLDVVAYFKEGSTRTDKPEATSLNYVAIGNLISLRGELHGGSLYEEKPNDGKGDWLLQHHATTYRKLLGTAYP